MIKGLFLLMSDQEESSGQGDYSQQTHNESANGAS